MNIRQTICTAILVLCAGCVETAKIQASADTKPDWPTSCSEAVNKIVSGLSPEDRAGLRKVPQQDLIQFHHGWGMGIRNEFGLWGGNEALARDCATTRGRPGADAMHPDNISMIIIEEVWRTIQ